MPPQPRELEPTTRRFSTSRTPVGLVRGLYALILWWGLSLASVVCAEATLTLEEFNSLKPKWPTLDGTTLQIEGRYSIFSPSQLRMEKCTLNFVFARDFPSPAGDSKTILIKGRLEKRETKLVFVISDLQPQPSDVDRFRSLKGKVSTNKPEEWYHLADWGSQRAKYYRDDDLKVEAVAAFRQGVLAEQRSLNPLTAADLRRLAQKLSTWSADPALQLEFQHEAFRLEYNAILKDNRGGDGELLTELKKQLLGTDVPLTPEDEPLRATYLASPLVAFKEGDAAARKKYARAFYVEVLKYRILKDASADGKNGFDIADRIESQLPEYRSLAPMYREKQLAYHLARVGALTRKEMNELIAQLEKRNVPDDLLQLKQRWITEKEKQVDPTSPSALVDVADDYMLILNDRESAIRLYARAYTISPGTQAISDWLTEQGLQRHNGQWLAKGEVPPEVDNPLAAAVRAGTVQPGMTAEQVKSALGVEPTRRTRVATSGHVQEWWLFEDHGLSVQFTRRRRPEPALVTKVMSLRGKTRPVKIEPEKPIGSGGF